MINSIFLHLYYVFLVGISINLRIDQGSKIEQPNIMRHLKETQDGQRVYT